VVCGVCVCVVYTYQYIIIRFLYNYLLSSSRLLLFDCVLDDT